jgi:hypothetical protein
MKLILLPFLFIVSAVSAQTTTTTTVTTVTTAPVAQQETVFVQPKAPLQTVDRYEITNFDTLITANRSDLYTFMSLNAQHNKLKVRELYRWLASQRLLINIQPGTTVDVTSYGGDGIAMISIGGTIGYIARADLNMYLGNFEK